MDILARKRRLAFNSHQQAELPRRRKWSVTCCCDNRFSIVTFSAILLIVSIVAIGSRRLKLPHSVGLVAAGIILALGSGLIARTLWLRRERQRTGRRLGSGHNVSRRASVFETAEQEIPPFRSYADRLLHTITRYLPSTTSTRSRAPSTAPGPYRKSRGGEASRPPPLPGGTLPHGIAALGTSPCMPADTFSAASRTRSTFPPASLAQSASLQPRRRSSAISAG